MSESDARVLVVEDDSMIRRLVATIVRRCGCVVEVAHNGEEALQKLRAERYDLVLLDLMLPRISGFEVLSTLARERPRQRVIVVTAASDGDLSRIDRTAVIAVVRKPFEIDNLRRQVERAIARPASGERPRLKVKPMQSAAKNLRVFPDEASTSTPESKQAQPLRVVPTDDRD